MPHPLLLGVTLNGEIIACIQYEDGGTTDQTFTRLEELRDLFAGSDFFLDEPADLQLQLLEGLDRLREETGAEQGRIALSPEGIQDMQFRARGTAAVLNLSQQTASNLSYQLGCSWENGNPVLETVEYSELELFWNIPWDMLEDRQDELQEFPDQFLTRQGRMIRLIRDPEEIES